MRPPTFQVLVGDCLRWLRELPSDSIHCVVTSPPYHSLRDYRRHDEQIGQEPTFDAWVARMVEVFREVRRVLRPEATLWLNVGRSYAGNRSFQGTAEGTDGVFARRAARLESGVGEVEGDDAYARKDRGQGGLGHRRDPAYKDGDLCMQGHLLAEALRRDGWWLRADVCWCLSSDTMLYARTQKGEGPATLKDLVRLDPSTVSLWTGKRWTKVTAWTKADAKAETLSLTLWSGERISCTTEHIWPTQRGLVKAGDLRIGDEIKTCVLPEPEDEVSPSLLPDDEIGWLVGMYLAEGSKGVRRASGSVVLQFARHAKEIDGDLPKFQRIAEAFQGTARGYCTAGKSATINVSSRILAAIVDFYVGGNESTDKHLKTTVWKRSNLFLDALLRGYFEGDGSFYPSGNRRKTERWLLDFSRNYALAADLRTLCARLGHRLRLRTRIRPPQILNGKWTGNRFCFTGFITRREEIHKHKGTVRAVGEIVKIGRSKGKVFWDVTVEDEPHLFALSSGVLTHNSKNSMPESVLSRPTMTHENVFMLAKSRDAFYDAEAVRKPGCARHATTGKKFRHEQARRRNRNGQREEVEDGEGAAKQNGNGAGAFLRDVWADLDGPDEVANFLDALWGEFLEFAAERLSLLDDAWKISNEPFPAKHFAVYPTELARRCVRAGTSAGGACARCGAPRERIVEKGDPDREAQLACGSDEDGAYLGKSMKDHGADGVQDASAVKARILAGMRERRTVGWRPTCACGVEESVPCVVLDVFAGSGRTGRAALAEGRDFLGIELVPVYAAMAEANCADPEWEAKERRRIREERKAMKLLPSVESDNPTSPRRSPPAGSSSDEISP